MHEVALPVRDLEVAERLDEEIVGLAPSRVSPETSLRALPFMTTAEAGRPAKRHEPLHRAECAFTVSRGVVDLTATRLSWTSHQRHETVARRAGAHMNLQVLRRLDFDRNAVCDMRTARDIERQFVRELIRVDSGLIARSDRELGTVAAVAKAVRQANDPRHHLLAHLRLGHDLTRARPDPRLSAVLDPEALGIIRRDEQSAAVLALRKHGHVVQPGVHVPNLSTANQHHPVRTRPLRKRSL